MEALDHGGSVQEPRATVRWIEKLIINIYTVAGDSIGDLQEGFVPPVLGGAFYAMPPFLWHMCARTVGDQVEFVVWTGDNPRPAYGDLTAGGQATIPDG
ncbi:MAG: hypothetical protein QOJ44_398 [Acidimicrobiaceae bacterium]|nr:hypothetical protein [Acidimicrobiaceae bacterium]